MLDDASDRPDLRTPPATAASTRAVTQTPLWRTIAGLAVLALCATLALAGLTMLGQRAKLSETNAQVTRTFAVIIALDGLESDLLAAESGQRGFLLAGDAGYLEDYRVAVRRIPERMASVRDAVGARTSAEQNALLTGIERGAAGKLTELERTIALDRAGRTAQALDVVRSNAGLELMTSLRGSIAAMRARENAGLSRAVASSNALARRTNLYIAASAFLLVGLMALAAWLASQAARDSALRDSLAQVEAERDRANLLRQELVHRMKNIFAITASVVSITAREMPGDSKAAARKMRDRIHALAKAHALSIGETTPGGEGGGEIPADLAAMARAIVAPYVPDGAPFTVMGGHSVARDRVTAFGLIFNELATNARKYGGLSEDGRGVAMTIAGAAEGDARITWSENSASATEPSADGEGFGSQLLRSALSQIGATLTRDWTSKGLQIEITFPA